MPPRGNKKKKAGYPTRSHKLRVILLPGGRSSAEQSDTDLLDDTASNVSSSSDLRSLTGEEGFPPPDAIDETEAQEDFEEKLRDQIDGTTQKSANGRKSCLAGLRQTFSRKVLPDFIDNRKVTITDCVERCLKKGKGEEQALAASVGSLLCVQLGSREGCEEIYNNLKPVMITIMNDKSAAATARAACAQALGLICFIAAGDMEEVVDIMGGLEKIFCVAYLKGDGTSPSHSPALQALHCAALSAWTLLLSIAPPSKVQEFVRTHLPKLPQLLQSDDVNMRIAAGEAIALLYELARVQDEDFLGQDLDSLCTRLKQLATESVKYIAKNDKRKQRSSFRDILRGVEEAEAPNDTVRFSVEEIYLDSWVKKRQYEAFKDSLGAGVNQHLQENELLRDIFSLGAPIDVAAYNKQNKISRFERHMYNSAAFKARTKVRSKQRDKRTVTA
ncbi:interferon-related developmental regulator 2-like isoform X1 [Branchiostoma floridae]|uniref:Interferon-related developmental regulator 2-like isoform X1 n=1 Tax=Branchiostoma floridae TaxID=7739 RepID=A0A9J7L522_BRAFL|nr:interferon-related developmental regulator 2-like isoform X1 [Branchiostoma floridae]